MDWTQIIVSVISAAVIGAAAGAYTTVVTTRQRIKRENRTDEVTVLQAHIDRLERALAQMDREAKTQDKDFLKLKDDHSACLIKYALADAESKRCRDDQVEMRSEISRLRERVAILESNHPGA